MGDRVHSFVHSSALFSAVLRCTNSLKQEMRLTLDFIGQNALFQMVGYSGFEPLTSSMSRKRSNQLS